MTTKLDIELADKLFSILAFYDNETDELFDYYVHDKETVKSYVEQIEKLLQSDAENVLLTLATRETTDGVPSLVDAMTKTGLVKYYPFVYSVSEWRKEMKLDEED